MTRQRAASALIKTAGRDAGFICIGLRRVEEELGKYKANHLPALRVTSHVIPAILRKFRVAPAALSRRLLIRCMMASLYEPMPSFRSRLSFMPLLAACEQVVHEGACVHACASVAQQFKACPELLEPIDNYALLQKHEALIADAMDTVFPGSLSLVRNLEAAVVPFSNRVIFASAYFHSQFMKDEHNYVLSLDPQVEENIHKAEVHLAYKIILQRYYGVDLHGGHTFICAYPDPEQDIHNYYELTWDPQFITVSSSLALPKLPPHILLNCHQVEDLVRFPELRGLLPLEEFVFDGLLIIHVAEVTERETLNNIRNLLQEEDAWEQPDIFDRFKDQMSYLLQCKEAELGVSTLVDHEQLSLMAPQLRGVLFQQIVDAGRRAEISTRLLDHFSKARHYTWSRDSGGGDLLDDYLQKTTWGSALFSALVYEGRIIGCLEIYLPRKHTPESHMIARVRAVLALLEASLQKCRSHLQNKVNRLVMDYFTAVQSSVEWRFNTAAMNYLYRQQTGQKPKMEDIVFAHVYPLYGSVDIRNSSGERNKAVQQDMLHQLLWIRTILQKAIKTVTFPLLDQLLLKTGEQEQSIQSYLFINDEQAVYTFLRQEAAQMLKQLRDVAPSCRQDIDHYFAALDPDSQVLKRQYTLYEESINRINNLILHLLEGAQEAIQEAYPHYFEHFMTDGVEFNMYIGQSIAPQKPFNRLHLQNLRLWELDFLVKAAREIHQLSPHLPIPMQTTQLVLVYSDPISISFNTAERKFEVEGVYNARYEVVKKRIDKAMVRNTNQRLTQPGQIAVVYSGLEEEREYREYFHYLQTKGLVQGEPEVLELEELQGVSGLKALRIQVVLEEPVKTGEQKELSTL